MTNVATAYQGSPSSPVPPVPSAGWRHAGHADQLAAHRAQDYLDAGLPLWHSCDELLQGGLYKFYCFQSPSGSVGVGALRFCGCATDVADTLGATANPSQTNPGTDTGGATDTSGDGSSSQTGASQQGASSLASDGSGVQTDAPSGGGGGTTPTPKPTPSPTPTPAPAAAPASSSSSTGLIIGVIAALAVGGTILAAGAAKHPAHR